MSLPRCPRCMTPIQYDWDYCHTCGLSAEEIVAGLADEPSAVVTDTPAGPDVASAPVGSSLDADGPSEWAPPADDPFASGGYSDDDWAEEPGDDPLAGLDVGPADDGEPEPTGSQPPPSFGSPPVPEPSPPSGPAPAGAFGVAAVGGIAGGVPGAPGFGGVAAGAPDPFAASGAPSAPSGAPSAPPSAAVPPAPPAAPAPAGGGAGGGHPGMTLMDDAPVVRSATPVLGGGVPKAGIIGGVAIFAVLILFLLVFGRGRADDPSAVGSGSTAPPLGAVGLNRTTVSGGGVTRKTEKYAEGKAGWIIFKPDDGSFSVEVPKPPNALKNTVVTLATGDVQALTFSVADANGGYFVALADVPDGDPQEVLKAFIAAYGKAIDFRWSTGGAGTHFDLPSRDFVYANDAPQQMNARAVKVGARVYILGAGGTDPSAYFWEHFRDSFKPGP